MFRFAPTFILASFSVLISSSLHVMTILPLACSSMSPSSAWTMNFFAFTSHVTWRLPDLSAMMIFSSPFLSSSSMKWPLLVLIFRSVLSSRYDSLIGLSLPFQSVPMT